MKKSLAKIWKWFDGKKTIIGGGLMIASYGTMQFASDHTVAYKVAGIVQYAADVTFLLGIGHKVQKKLPSGLKERISNSIKSLAKK